MKEFCRVLISAPTEDEANRIAEMLVKEKLAAGALITKGKSAYWWKGEVARKDYWNISVFSLWNRKDDIVKKVEVIHSDEAPIIAFFEMDGNQKFLDWIRRELS